MSCNRRRTRVRGRFEGVITVKGREIHIITENLSLKGLLCHPDSYDPALEPDQECTVRIDLGEKFHITINGRIARLASGDTAVDFLSMDEESYSHLRNVVRYSSNDADAIDQEQAQRPFLDG